MVASINAAVEAARLELVITRTFDAPARVVFEAWTKPDHLACWWGPEGFTMPSCAMDVRPGGAFRFCMRGPDGTDHWLRGVYREIVAPERLVFTWAWEDAQGKPGHETLLKVDFVALGTKTKVILHQGVFESANARDEHRSGWGSSLDRFAEYVTTEAE